MSMDMDISDKSDDSWKSKSDLSSSSKNLMGGGGGQDKVVEGKADDTDKGIERRPRSYNSFFTEMFDVPTFGTEDGWEVEEEDKDTRRSLFKECKDEENKLDVFIVPFPPKDGQDKENELNEGKGIMLCMPVTEVRLLLPILYLFTCAHDMFTNTNTLSLLYCLFFTRCSSNSLSHHHMMSS